MPGYRSPKSLGPFMGNFVTKSAGGYRCFGWLKPKQTWPINGPIDYLSLEPGINAGPNIAEQVPAIPLVPWLGSIKLARNIYQAVALASRSAAAASIFWLIALKRSAMPGTASANFKKSSFGTTSNRVASTQRTLAG